MTRFRKILYPIDLSDNSLAAVDLATALAKHNGATLVFLFVAPQWIPDESMFGSKYIDATVSESKKLFLEIRPTDDAVEHEHVFVHGNPGPEIVNAAKSCDLIVMSTHGQSGIMRFLMGSVAQYVMRNATCPVFIFKNTKIETKAAGDKPQKQLFVTELMHHVCPIQSFDKIEKVVAELDRAKESGAPVVDELGNCIGILTKTDIEKYRELQKRFEQRDETVLDEMFEVDEFGQRRPTNLDFDQVRRHMTSPVVTISNTQSCQTACELFENNQNIHHLVVIDESNQPIGILETRDVIECNRMSSGT